jgi:serine/threonine protein kinase
MSSPLQDDVPGDAGTEAPTRQIEPGIDVEGTMIGPYRLLEPIGQGGMGEVWLAEQKHPVRRRVAIKLIKAGMDTREVVARFESERQALALMDHPAIAKVFEAGSTEQGRPYFVMEYVTGIAITDYCDKHKLNTQQRLELFIRVCEGVQHAHQKAILHRDLKPSNILVGEIDGKPMPKIIDFGVAKATSHRLTAATLFTQVGALIGTPAYMSPEQADSAGQDVDTRTDVYSLGVVLYELLVGALPLDFSKVPLNQISRTLREQDAPRPSSKLRTLGEQSSVVAQNRSADPPTLVRQLRGDLDAITLKALEKDRARRYATPSELADDIGRYLHNEPVMARPASAGYRARKYARRHRIGVAVAAAVVMLLISFAVVQAFQLQRITRERDRANRIAEFMTGMFDGSAVRINSITALLDKASKEIDLRLSRDPELEAQMMHRMGNVYYNLGGYSQAQSLLTRAIDVRRRVLGLENPDTLSSMSLLGLILAYQGGHLAEAEKLTRETLDIRRRVLGPQHPDTLKSMSYLAFVLSAGGQYTEAEKLARETLDTQRRVLGPQHPDTLQSMNQLAINIFMGEGRLAEAEKLTRETLDIQRRVLGPEDPNTVATMGALAVDLSYEGRNAEAEKLIRETLDIQRRILGAEHPVTLQSMYWLAHINLNEGRNAEAEKLIRETLDVQRRILGAEHVFTLDSMKNLGTALSREGHNFEAEKFLRETLDIFRRVYGADNLDTADTIYILACAVARAGQREKALSLLREAIDHGLDPVTGLGIDKAPDLKSLHGDPRFTTLVAHAKEQAAAAQKPK